LKDIVPKSNCEQLRRQGSTNPNREVGESPPFHGGELVKPKGFRWFERVAAIAALALCTGCSPSEGFNAAASTPSFFQLAQNVGFPNSADPFGEAVSAATRAANLAQTASSAAQWDEVAKAWLQAIYWMQSVPPESPKRAFAQKKVQEYMRYLAYAQQQTARSSSLYYPTFGSAVLDTQIELYLSYWATIGRPDVLIVGSSRALQGVDPQALQQALAARGKPGLKIFNFSINGATAQVVNFKLQKLLGPDRLPKMILWADGVRAFNSGRLDRTYNEIVASPGYQLLVSGVRPSLGDAVAGDRLATALSEDLERSANFKGDSLKADDGAIAPVKLASVPQAQFVEFRDPVAVATLARAIPVERAIDANGFLSVATRFDPTRYYRNFPRVPGAYDGDYAGFDLGGSQDAALKAVTQFARSRRIPMTIVNLPVTWDYLDPTREWREVQFRQYMRQASQRAFLWRDLSTQNRLMRNDYFADPSHLNRYGAAAVARALAADTHIPWPQPGS
jgi:hypothetical protein